MSNKIQDRLDEVFSKHHNGYDAVAGVCAMRDCRLSWAEDQGHHHLTQEVMEVLWAPADLPDRDTPLPREVDGVPVSPEALVEIWRADAISYVGPIRYALQVCAAELAAALLAERDPAAYAALTADRPSPPPATSAATAEVA